MRIPADASRNKHSVVSPALRISKQLSQFQIQCYFGFLGLSNKKPQWPRCFGHKVRTELFFVQYSPRDLDEYLYGRKRFN